MSTKLKKWHAGPLLAGLTLSIAILAVLLLPGWGEAQEVDTDAVSIETAQDTKNHQPNAPDEVTTATMSTVTTPQSAYEPAAAALVVEPGDSLWAIAQERLGPEATSQQVAEETTRIYELNRQRIGDNPNLIFPGQELLLTQRPEPAADLAPTTGVAATEPAAGEPAADGLAGEEPATLEQPTAADEEAVPDPTQDESVAENDEPSYPSPYYSEQRVPDVLTVLISLGFFLGALAVAALAVAKLLGRRSLLGEPYRSSSYEPLTGPQEEDNNDDHSAERGAPSPEAEPKTESEAEPTSQGPAASAAATRDIARRRRRQRAVLAARRQRRWRRGRYTGRGRYTER